MHYIIFAQDKPGAADIRANTRPDHLQYLKSKSDILVTAGPMQSDDGETMIGSMLVIDVADRAAAEDFAKGDPYAKAGLFESVIIKRWKRTIPAD